MLIKASFLLSVALLTLGTSEQILCFENSTLLETTGDAILTGKRYSVIFQSIRSKSKNVLCIIYIYVEIHLHRVANFGT